MTRDASPQPTPTAVTSVAAVLRLPVIFGAQFRLDFPVAPADKTDSTKSHFRRSRCGTRRVQSKATRGSGSPRQKGLFRRCSTSPDSPGSRLGLPSWAYWTMSFRPPATAYTSGMAVVCGNSAERSERRETWKAEWTWCLGSAVFTQSQKRSNSVLSMVGRISASAARQGRLRWPRHADRAELSPGTGCRRFPRRTSAALSRAGRLCRRPGGPLPHGR